MLCELGKLPPEETVLMHARPQKPEEAVPDAAVRENEYRIVNGRSRAVKKWSVGPPGSNDCTPGVYTSGCALYDVPGGTWYDPDIYSAEGVPAVAICHEG
jgi:hypothetical protein